MGGVRTGKIMNYDPLRASASRARMPILAGATASCAMRRFPNKLGMTNKDSAP